MQALGAYGFLGLRKGLKVFLDHIPAALNNLHRAASQTASLPRLLDLSLACRQAADPRNSPLYEAGKNLLTKMGAKKAE
jgi:hypothetical protein